FDPHEKFPLKVCPAIRGPYLRLSVRQIRANLPEGAWNGEGQYPGWRDGPPPPAAPLFPVGRRLFTGDAARFGSRRFHRRAALTKELAVDHAASCRQTRGCDGKAGVYDRVRLQQQLLGRPERFVGAHIYYFPLI